MREATLFGIIAFIPWMLVGRCESSYSQGECKIEEKLNLALEGVQAPAVVLAEYSDVKTATDCFMKCCQDNAKGCNAISFLNYDGITVCMNAKCVPFERCIWGPYPKATAGRVSQATGNSTIQTNTTSVNTTTDNNTTSSMSVNATTDTNTTSSMSVNATTDTNTTSSMSDVASENTTINSTNANVTNTTYDDSTVGANFTVSMTNSTLSDSTTTLLNTTTGDVNSARNMTVEQTGMNATSYGNVSGTPEGGHVTPVVWNVRTTQSSWLETTWLSTTDKGQKSSNPWGKEFTTKSWLDKFPTKSYDSLTASPPSGHTSSKWSTTTMISSTGTEAGPWHPKAANSVTHESKPANSIDGGMASARSLGPDLGPYMVLGFCVCVGMLVLFAIVLARRCAHAKERARYLPLKSDAEPTPYYDDTNGK